MSRNYRRTLSERTVRWIAGLVIITIAGVLTAKKADAAAPGFIPALDQYGNPICITDIYNCFK